MDVHDSTTVPAKTIERFWSMVDRSAGPDACWPWTGKPQDRKGYGRAPRGLGSSRAHRVAYLLSCGEIPAGMFVMHSCDNPPCCNPAHLRVGTSDDNVRDRDAKGRQARGERHGWYTHPERRPRGERSGTHTCPESRPVGTRNGQSKLTEIDIPRIREAYSSGETKKGIARRFGVTDYTIRLVLTGRSWRHVPAAGTDAHAQAMEVSDGRD